MSGLEGVDSQDTRRAVAEVDSRDIEDTLQAREGSQGRVGSPDIGLEAEHQQVEDTVLEEHQRVGDTDQGEDTALRGVDLPEEDIALEEGEIRRAILI